jgi:hypothetical protein
MKPKPEDLTKVLLRLNLMASPTLTPSLSQRERVFA